MLRCYISLAFLQAFAHIARQISSDTAYTHYLKQGNWSPNRKKPDSRHGRLNNRYSRPYPKLFQEGAYNANNLLSSKNEMEVEDFCAAHGILLLIFLKWSFPSLTYFNLIKRWRNPKYEFPFDIQSRTY